MGICLSQYAKAPKVICSNPSVRGGSNCLECVGILKVFLDYREESEAKLDSRFIVGKNIVYLLSIQISYFTIYTSIPLFFLSLSTTHLKSTGIQNSIGD